MQEVGGRSVGTAYGKSLGYLFREPSWKFARASVDETSVIASSLPLPLSPLGVPTSPLGVEEVMISRAGLQALKVDDDASCTRICLCCAKMRPLEKSGQEPGPSHA